MRQPTGPDLTVPTAHSTAGRRGPCRMPAPGAHSCKRPRRHARPGTKCVSSSDSHSRSPHPSVQRGLLHDAQELILIDLTVAVAVRLVDHLLQLLVRHVLAKLAGRVRAGERQQEGSCSRVTAVDHLRHLLQGGGVRGQWAGGGAAGGSREGGGGYATATDSFYE